MYNYEFIDDENISINISKEAYNILAIKKCCSNFMDISFIKIEEDEYNYKLFLRFKKAKNIAEQQIVVDNFYNELLAESIRYDVSKETKNIREMIIGRALYATCVKDDEGNVHDVDNHFSNDLNEVISKNNYSIDDIAVNWFKKENE